MGPSLELAVNGDVQIRRRLVRFAGAVEDASPAFREIAGQFADNERRQFESDGAYGSGGWRALAQSTVLAKLNSQDPRIRANATSILRATGDTMASLVGNGPGHVEIVQPQQLTWGTTVPQAKYHQPDPQGRRIIEVPEHGRQQAVKTLQAYLVSTLRGAQLRGLA